MRNNNLKYNTQINKIYFLHPSVGKCFLYALVRESLNFVNKISAKMLSLSHARRKNTFEAILKNFKDYEC